ncbi:MAG: hypothetical protein H6855_00305 [Rhodospirillales bacterium]|nr:hypothetical protein [Rhodospirillales bacterium]MCB9964510.1 hypothetical protein [Rhodospirillales bacterium]MCB9973783.1 hypothetical protein [Rhodospirillales bacterium]MCB9980333.1 hypothetical protein [Rhodospirillales bacterium]
MSTSKLFLTSLAALSVMALPVFAGAAHAEGKMPPPPRDGSGPGGALFEKMDTDGDGKISEAEHMEGAKSRFSKMDTDSDGFVTKDEMRAQKEKMHEKFKGHKQKCMGAPESEDAPEPKGE